MSVWGKVLGGAAGFAVGGPLGSLLGMAAGHAVDSMRSSVAQPVSTDWARTDANFAGPSSQGAGDHARGAAFTVGVIVLAAKLAKADGRVSPEEIRAFQRVFSIPADERAAVDALFNHAQRDAMGFEPYARQLGHILRHQPEMLEELLDGLFEIALSDGRLSPEEEAYIERCARLFRLPPESYARARAASQGYGRKSGESSRGSANKAGSKSAEKEAYAVLALDEKSSDEELKARWRSLARDYHPDRIIGQGLPEEFVALANNKLAAINSAYEEISRRRGLR